MNHVFGPVPSRRLGQSLGIDPVPLKTCNWNCVYCQLGRSNPMTNIRKTYFPSDEILAEVKEALSSHKPGEIDWVTFVGSGETTLHDEIGKMIHEVKLMTPLPVAVITNGSLLYRPEMRKELLEADAVLPTLDAGNEELYKKINRPHPEFTFQRQVEGLKSFRRMYRGKLWVEVMLVGGVNDTEAALTELAALLAEIKPDEVHILQPDRPPAETWVRPADEEGLLRSRAILGKIAKVIPPAKGLFDLGGNENLVDSIVGIITRHPMHETDLIETLSRFSEKDVLETLRELEKSGKAQIVNRYGVRFWSASPSIFPQNE